MRAFGRNIKIYVGLLALFGVVTICGMLTSTASEMPGAYIDAVGTATAIAPAIAATVSYNDRVVPTVQHIEALESVETVETREANARAVSTAWAIVRVFVLAVAATGACIWFAVQVGASSWERAKRARVYEPWQRLPDHAYLLPALGVGGNTVTGAQWKLNDAHPASVEHGQLLIAARKPSIGDVLVAMVTRRPSVPRYRVTARNGERHELLEAEIVE